MLTRRSKRLVAALAVGILLPAAARADFTALTSASQINAPAYTFDDLPGGVVTSATNTLTASDGFTFVSPSGDAILAVSTGNQILDIADGVVRFRFENLVEAAGIEYDTATTLSLIAYDNAGNPINADGSITGSADTAGFFGIYSDLGIREILIHDTAFSFRLDNLSFGNVASGVISSPVPASWMLGALGLGLFGAIRRRF